MKKKKLPILKFTKETPEARKHRISSGVKFRAVIFENKKRRIKNKSHVNQELRIRKFFFYKIDHRNLYMER